MNGDRDKLTVLVTGASAGIGAAIAAGLAKSGHQVFVCARRKDRLAKLAEDHPGIEATACDVSDDDQVKELAEFVGSRAAKLDAIINCAGLFGAIGRLDQTQSQEWRQAFDINVFGTYLVIKHCLPMLTKPGSLKKIINFSGGGAFSAFPNYSAYAVSKAAVVRLTENIAEEFAPLGVSANCLAPGFVKTEIHDATLKAGGALAGTDHYANTLKQLSGEAFPVENSVKCVQFLLGPKSIGLTGKTISVNFDPWNTPEFSRLIPEINRAELYTQRRINLKNLGEEARSLKTALEAVSARKNP